MLEPKKNYEYDAILPLGGSCSVAFQLQHRGKRIFATPLDWTLITDERALEYLPMGIATDFSEFCRRENLRRFAEPLKEKYFVSWPYEDTLTGFRFLHHFHDSIDKAEVYDKVYSVIGKRMRRMTGFCESAGKILFVLATRFAYDVRLAENILKALKSRYPRLQSELLAMQFSAGAAENIRQQPDLLVMRIPRPIDDTYDMTITSAEWGFLDWLSVKGLKTDKQARRGFWNRMAYRVWNHLGKTMERKRMGTMSLKFTTFKEA